MGKDRVELDWPGISPMLQGLLSARGISGAEEALAFLHPSLNDMCDPFLLPDMDKAVQRIIDALEDGESICVYGDYDVDGVTATAILVEFFRKQNARVRYYIPSRHGEGYGLNVDAIREISKECSLLITVDCGVTAAKEVDIAGKLGLDVIITDHHQVSGEIPLCCAVVDPVLGEGHTPLCGAGVALKLVHALGGEEEMMAALDFAALGTIADIVPLHGENRTITKFGLEKLRQTKRPGIAALCWIAGVEPSEMQSSHISFLLAPRINAGGRLGHSGRCVDLLLSDDPDYAREIAKELDDENNERRRVEQEIFQEADAQVTGIDFLRDRIILAHGDWNPGVIGLAASKLVEKYHWPVILLSHQGDQMVGSGRSIKGLNLHAALLSISDIFERFGGHEQAAGLTLKAERYEEFARRIQEALLQYPRESYLEVERYDVPLQIPEINDTLLSEMEKMQPFGYGNHAPQFLIERVSLVNAQKVGHTKSHLKMRLSDGKNLVDAIAFKMGEKIRNLSGLFDVIGVPVENVWNGTRTLQCEVRAMRHSLEPTRYLANCRQHVEENLRVYFDRCFIPMEKGDRAGRTIHQEEALWETIAEAGKSVQGYVLIAKTPEMLQMVLEAAGNDLLQDKIQLGEEPLYDARGFNALLYAGKLLPENERIQTYKQVLLLDGDWGDARAISHIFPDAEVIAVHTPLSAKCALPYLKRMHVDVDALRSLYIAIKKDAPNHGKITDTKALLRRYSSVLDNDVLQLQVGFAIFKEMRLIDVDVDSGMIALLPPYKCDIYASTIYQAITERYREFMEMVSG